MFETTSIKFTSRASVKIKDSYYTFEACIEKQCPLEVANKVTDDEITEIKTKLWDEVNAEVDGQIEQVIGILKK